MGIGWSGILRAELLAASKTGIFGMILIGLCSLLLGLLTRFFSMGHLIYFATMAGVLIPTVMVAAGMIAWWASDNPPAYPVRRRADDGLRVLSSLLAGIVTAFGGSIVWLATVALTSNDAFALSMLSDASASPGSSLFIELAVLVAAYVALSVIGGILYGLVVPKEKPYRY